MSEPAAVTLTVIRQFADLFARVRRPFIQEAETGWVTRHDSLEDTHLHAHLHGVATFGVRLEKADGGGRIASNLALEVDFGDRETPVDAVLADILGERGLTLVTAIHDAGQRLGIPPGAWVFAWSGGRSLHAWLTLRDWVPLTIAYTVARSLHDAVNQRIASCGLHVCTAWPTNAKRQGKAIRLPWSRHQGTGERGRFVNLRDGALTLREPFSADAGYLAELERNMLDSEVIAQAATLTKDLDPVREPVRSLRPRLTVPRRQLEEGARIERTLPTQARRIARPCILHLVESGVPETLRHDMALLLRAELKHCGLTPEETWPVYRRYAAACSPPWEEDDARRDLEANWTVTDPARRHVCPGRGEPSSLTQYLHKHCCVGTETCGFRRAAPVLEVWRDGLEASARALYIELAMLEAGYSLRPGDAIHTTTAELMRRCRLGRRPLEKARDDLRDAGLLEYRPTGVKGGAGTPDGGVHSLYRRVIPFPDPPDAGLDAVR